MRAKQAATSLCASLPPAGDRLGHTTLYRVLRSLSLRDSAHLTTPLTWMAFQRQSFVIVWWPRLE